MQIVCRKLWWISIHSNQILPVLILCGILKIWLASKIFKIILWKIKREIFFLNFKELGLKKITGIELYFPL